MTVRVITHDTWCDGYATVHNSVIVREDHGLRRVVCPECGPVTPLLGRDATDVELRRLATCRPQFVPCTGQCL